jgi:hypothetical protein
MKEVKRAEVAVGAEVGVTLPLLGTRRAITLLLVAIIVAATV